MQSSSGCCVIAAVRGLREKMKMLNKCNWSEEENVLFVFIQSCFCPISVTDS